MIGKGNRGRQERFERWLFDRFRSRALIAGVQVIVEEAIEVSARDDGHSLAITRAGAGLTGMKERFESLGGRVEFSLQGNAGFALRAQLPAQSRDRFA